MAREHAGAQAKAPWTKIFTAFKLALDFKKLLLAAAGILLTCGQGWQVLSWTFYGMRSFPEYPTKTTNTDELKSAWTDFKARRASWNLLHELAGPPSVLSRVDAADVTSDLDEFDLLYQWEKALRRLSDPIQVKDDKLILPKKDLTLTLTPQGKDASEAMPRLREKSLTLQSLDIIAEKKEGDAEPAKDKFIRIDGFLMKVDGQFENLKKYREEAWTVEQIKADAAKPDHPKAAKTAKALEIFKTRLINPQLKPSGKLRTLPWFEYRGGNPYLMVTSHLKTGSEVVSARMPVLSWLVDEQAPVVLEPIYKFLTPLVYLFDVRAGFWDRLYLVAVMLWTLAIWGFFGGAICRIAAVQVARNERITLKEALQFARERYLSYLVAPLFQIALIAILVFVLMLFGWVEWIPWVGDVFAGVFWPVVLVIGFIMAIVLVGLVGWPLMNATISTEGSDSFDALSRSYSYVYQAPWQYLWYNFLAILYGAALVFFVGFMASLLVFLGKFGVASAFGLASSNPATDREPSYLFYYAPTSFGWRDLLISNSQFVEDKVEELPSGRKIVHKEFTEEYKNNLGKFNRVGAGLVAIWMWILFLLVVGFGYSYFWSASTIVYFLMRYHVDDTDMDEVHLEDEGLEDPFMKPAAAKPAPPPPPPSKPGTLSLNVIEGPPPPPSLPLTPPNPLPTASMASEPPPANRDNKAATPTPTPTGGDGSPAAGNGWRVMGGG